MLRTVVAVLGLAVVALHAVPAGAQAVCGDRTILIAELDRQFDERPIAIGITSGGALIEVLTSPKGTWTFLVTFPNGSTCIVATGDSWEMLAPRTAEQVS
jgi:hypothetical protein